MATWRKVIVSGSTAELNGLSLSGDLTVAGGDIVLGSTSIFSGGDTATLNNIDALDATTETTIEAAIDTLSNLTAANSLVTVSTLSSGAISSGFGNIDIGTSTLNAGNVTVDKLTNDSAIGDSSITGSFTGSFTGDGSSLTGVAQDIDSLSALGGATLHQTQDFFHFSDNGTEKKITFNNVCDSLYADISGDILIAAGGTATIQANSVALTTDTTGDYIAKITGGTGIDSSASGEGADTTLTLDLNELTTETSIADDDFIAMVDATDDGSGKITFENLEDAIFASVSGDIVIAEDGAATIQANSVALSTDTTGDYVGTLGVGAGMAAVNADGEGSSKTIAVDGVLEDLDTLGAAGSDGQFIVATGAGAFQYETTTTARTSLGVGTGDSPQFNEIELGHATQNTLTAASGELSIEGAQLAKLDGNLQDLDTLGAAASDGQFIVATGAGVFGYESGATLRTSIGVGTGNSPSFTDLTLSGDLTVNGDLTYLNTSNLLVKDQFIYAASGSSDVDGGLIVGGTTIGSGSALYWDKDSDRWSTQESVAQNATAVTPKQFVVTTTVSATASPGSSDGDYGIGEMWIEEDSDDIWIRTA